MSAIAINQPAFSLRSLIPFESDSNKNYNSDFEYSMLKPQGKKSFVSILSNAAIGIWSADLRSRKLNLCPVSLELLKDCADPLTNLYFLNKLSRSEQTEFFEEEINLASDNGEKWFKFSGKRIGRGIAQKVEGVITDITETKTSQISTKDQMAFLSHELKTPLTTVKLCLQMAVKKAHAEQDLKTEDMLRMADRQVETMTGMIDNSLDLSLVEKNKMELSKSQFDIVDVISSLINEMKFVHPSVVFKVHVPDPIFINADMDKIKQVLSNYITNAVKFSKENYVVAAACYQSGDDVIVSVIDNGVGISDEDQKLLFIKNSRINAQTPNAPKGYGIGLYLSKEIIEKHQGNVGVKSVVGMGSIFSFTLPL